MSVTSVAVIVDIVGSRHIEDRRGAQRGIHDAFDLASSRVDFLQPLWSTVGDEFQAVVASVSAALTATAIARLTLPEGVDCRFGFGLGEVHDVEIRPSGSIQDGPAWWRAREGIDEAHRREARKSPFLRGWFVSDAPESEYDALVNSFLLMRDGVIGGMRPRERRLAAGILLGRSQAELARTEEISQPAVSQSLQRSGGAVLVAAHRLFDPSTNTGATA